VCRFGGNWRRPGKRRVRWPVYRCGGEKKGHRVEGIGSGKLGISTMKEKNSKTNPISGINDNTRKVSSREQQRLETHAAGND